VKVATYLNFDGNCREAMQFYQKCLGAELQLTPFMDTQGKPSTQPDARILHSELLKSGNRLLMASDTQPGSRLQFGNNFHVSVDFASLEEIERVFVALAHKGRVTVPLGDAPWGARIAMLTDQFGVQWILNCFLAR
jgi:PhnB protein